MTITSEFTPKLARKMFAYDPYTGELRYKPRQPHMFLAPLGGNHSLSSAAAVCTGWNTHWVGKRAGFLQTTSGSRRVSVGRYAKSLVSAASLIWFMQYNEWPPSWGPYAIVHANGDNSDDRLGNLMTRQAHQMALRRDASHAATNAPRPRQPVPPQFPLLAVQYKQEKSLLHLRSPKRTPEIHHRGARKQAAYQAIKTLERMVQVHPEFAATKAYHVERTLWRAWLREHKFFHPVYRPNDN